MISAWKRIYGESPLHLLGQLVAFAIAAYAIIQIVDVRSTGNLSLVLWLFGGALLHDVIFLPVYLTLDLVARLGLQDHALRPVRAINHVRFPAVISAVMFVTLFPLILGRGEPNFIRTAGEQAPDYLGRWLAITAGLFAVSALVYALRLRQAAGRGSHARVPAAVPPA